MISPAIRRFVSVTVFGGLLAAAAGADPLETRRTDVVSAGGGAPLTLVGSPASVGAPAPEFTALDRSMRPVSLSDFSGQVVIVTAFPSVDTKVCSLQTRRFNEEAAKLPGVQVLSISMDLPFALERFCAAEGIDAIRTLSDHRSADFGRKYGFLIEELRLLARGSVVIDAQGVVRYVEWVPELGREPDYDTTLAAARALLPPADADNKDGR